MKQTYPVMRRWLTSTPTGRRIGRATLTAVAVLLWIGVWYLAAARLNSPLLLPTPRAVFARLGEWTHLPSFWAKAGLSLLRVLGGILSGLAAAIIIAALTAAFPLVHALLRPLITVIKTTPVASFIILAMLWIHEDILPAFISFLMVFPVVWANLHTALTSVPSAYMDLSRVYRLSPWCRVRRIFAPHALPYFLSACRSALGLAWKAGIAAEVLALPMLSIGKQLYESKLYLETTDLFAWTTVVILLSLLLDIPAEFLARRADARRSQVKEVTDRAQT